MLYIAQVSGEADICVQDICEMTLARTTLARGTYALRQLLAY
jgi:hypothetical protein